MKKLLLCMVVLGFILTVPMMATALPFTKLEAAVGGWNYSPSGDLAYNPLSSADTLDIEDDLNFDEDTKVTVRVKLELPIIPKIYVMASSMDFDGTGNKASGFKFGDKTFTTGNFDSSLTIDQYDVALYYGIPFTGLATLGKLNIDLGINVRFMDIDAEITGETSPATIETESESVSAPIPMLYASVQVGPIAGITIEVEGRGVSYQDNTLISMIGRLKFDIFGPVFAAGGYRYDNLKVDEDDVEVDETYGGLFLEAGLEF